MDEAALLATPIGRNQLLRQAASNDDVAQVHQLLACAADPNAADAEGWTSLHWSCAHVDVARLLIDAGAAVDASDWHGKTTLHWAATQGQEEVAALLIAAGANVNARDHENWTPLQWAHEHAHVARLLIRSGADVDATDKFGKTCLHWSAQDGKPEVVQLLLQAGSGLNRPDFDGMTPLHWACCGGHEEAVRLLLQAGASASIEALDSQSLTPLSWAVYHGHTSVVQQLLQQRQQQYLQRCQRQGSTEADASVDSFLSEDTLTAAVELAGSHGNMDAFALLIVELGQYYPAALHRLVHGPHIPPAEDAVLAMVGRCLADRQLLEQQRQQLEEEKAALQRERDELELLRMGVQHLVVQSAGVVRRAMQTTAVGAQKETS